MKQFFLWSKSIPSPIWGSLPPYHHSKMKSSIINRGGAVFQADTQVLIDKLLCNSFMKLQISHMILRQLLWDIYIKWSKLFYMWEFEGRYIKLSRTNYLHSKLLWSVVCYKNESLCKFYLALYLLCFYLFIHYTYKYYTIRNPNLIFKLDLELCAVHRLQKYFYLILINSVGLIILGIRWWNQQIFIETWLKYWD